MTAAAPLYPAWMTHDGHCAHPPGDSEHLALVLARFGGGDPIELVTLLAPPADATGSFWELRSNGHGRRRHYTVGRRLGDVDRGLVAGISNRSVGDGWRTCQLALTDGTSMAVRVSARSVPGLVAAFPEAG